MGETNLSQLIKKGGKVKDRSIAGPQEHPEPGHSILFSDLLYLPNSSLSLACPQLLPCGGETILTDAAMGERLDLSSWLQTQNSRERLLLAHLESLGAQHGSINCG